MQILLSIVCTFILLFGLIFASFAGGFGLGNFINSHGKIFSALAIGAWLSLFSVHLYAIYKVWSVDEKLWLWVVIPAAMHLIFFSIFGRNVSTRG